MAYSAFGILGAGLGLLAGFIVLDAIAGTVRCTTCGQDMHASKQAEHSKIHQTHPHENDEDIFSVGRGLDEGLGF